MSSLVDKTTGQGVFGAAANMLAVYDDGGRIYQFGNEYGQYGWSTSQGSWAPGDAVVVESGPLRARVVASATWTPPGANAGSQQAYEFVYEYVLHAGEPLLRVSVTGVAPEATSVLVSLPLGGPITAIEHGTGIHWDGELPTVYWQQQTFQPTHDYVLASTASGYAIGVYHLAMHAWGAAYDGAPPVPENVLYGCLFRNVTTPDSGDGSMCDGVQTVHYAIRVPGGLAGSASGLPLREALAYHTPLEAAVVPSSPALPSAAGGALPRAAALLAITPDTAIVTAAKPAQAAPDDLILRIYQPTNEPLTVQVTLGDGSGPVPTVTGVTAREQPMAEGAEDALDITTTAGRFSFNAQRAVTTLRIASWLRDPGYTP